jgi:hypothetical protein
MARKQKWGAGDNFLVPLKDGTFGQGQVVIAAQNAMNSAVCVFSGTRHHGQPEILDTPLPGNSISILFVTRDLLDSGRWQVRNNEANFWAADQIHFGELEGKGFVGAKIIGSGIVERLLSAFHGLEPWNDFHDPNYLDGLLLSRDRKPASVLRV